MAALAAEQKSPDQSHARLRFIQTSRARPAAQKHQILGGLQAPQAQTPTRHPTPVSKTRAADVIITSMTDARIRVRLQARARSDEVVGFRGGVLLARVSAPPVDGRANRAICRLIARRVGVAPSRVTIIRGERSREKLLRVHGVDQSALSDALLHKS